MEPRDPMWIQDERLFHEFIFWKERGPNGNFLKVVKIKLMFSSMWFSGIELEYETGLSRRFGHGDDDAQILSLGPDEQPSLLTAEVSFDGVSGLKVSQFPVLEEPIYVIFIRVLRSTQPQEDRLEYLVTLRSRRYQIICAMR
jgi:hypothetical protein